MGVCWNTLDDDFDLVDFLLLQPINSHNDDNNNNYYYADNDDKK